MERTTSWHAEVEGSFSVHFVSSTFSTVYSRYSGHIYSGHLDKVATFPGIKIHLFYYIQVGYSGQSDIVARNCWPKVATISEVHCTMYFLFLIWLCICNHMYRNYYTFTKYHFA